MAFNISDTLDVVLGHVASSGHVSGSSLGEPVIPPEGVERLFGSVYMRSTSVLIVYGDGATQESHVVVVRLYRPVLREPVADGERELAIAASELLEDLAEDFTLGATVREIDVAGGQGGVSLGSEWGHIEMGNLMYRVVDITVPVIVDDSATSAP